MLKPRKDIQPLFQKISLESWQGAFLVLRGRFHVVWHYHPEIEITYVEHGRGVRYVGDSEEYFDAGDLVLVGSLLPHVWLVDPEYYQLNPGVSPESKVILFEESCLGERFFELKEMTGVKKLLQFSKRGIRFMGRSFEKLIPSIKSMDQYRSTTESLHEKVAAQSTFAAGKKIILLLEILHQMSRIVFLDGKEGEDYEFLNQSNYEYQPNEDLTEPLGQALTFMSDHFHEKISVEEIAEKADMPFRTFSRYFKKRTGKTAGAYLTELRIEQAMVKLIETDDSIQTIAESCGFSQLPHFSNRFKKLTGQTPSEYRQEARERYFSSLPREEN
jgi:AraC-like DNA-binding protein